MLSPPVVALDLSSRSDIAQATDSPAEPASSVVEQPLSPQVQALLEQLNTGREQRGLPPFVLNPQLTVAAQAHAADMAQGDFFAHRGSDESTVETRVQRTGYSAPRLAENIAGGKANPADIFAKWLDGIGYRRNLLNPEYREVGIGYAYNIESDFGHYWTLVLAPDGGTASGNPAEVLLALTNEVRQRACLPLVQPHRTLTAIAQAEADALATASTIPDGRDRHDPILEQFADLQYEAAAIAALFAADATSPETVFNQWQSRSVSRDPEPLLVPDYTHIGFGQGTGDRPIWSLILAEPRFPTIEVPSSEPFLREQDRLEPGVDEVLPVDGSTYDLYSFEARAGQSITITLNSSEFDTYLFLFNSDNVQIADNDDRSATDTNSQMQVTLPCDGVYKVMVNSYDPTSRGAYELTLHGE